MRLADWRPGWRTEGILPRFDGELLERGDCLVVRTPSNPSFYWGNCLMLSRLPRDDEVAHWCARFDEEIARREPRCRHVAIGVDDDWHGERRPAWEAAGFELQVTTMLCLQPGGRVPPARPPRGAVRQRALDLGREADALLAVEMTAADGFEPASYRDFLRGQHRRYRAMQDAGLLRWFGVWCDGTLAATCGLMRDHAGPGAQGRFQRVVTHAAFRRRGLARQLVDTVTRHALDAWQCSTVWIAADPDDVAVHLYRQAGFRDHSSGIALQRKAPEDRGR